MVFSCYKKQRILHFYQLGLKPPSIRRALEEEGLKASRQGITMFLKCYHNTGTINRKQGSGRRGKITAEIRALVEERMRTDDETSAVQLHAMIAEKGYTLSITTVLRCRRSMGWTFRGSAYCQLIRSVNKAKRLEWARAHRGYSFEDVIFTDECSVQLESHRRFCCRKVGEKPKNKPRYKAPKLYCSIIIQLTFVHYRFTSGRSTYMISLPEGKAPLLLHVYMYSRS